MTTLDLLELREWLTVDEAARRLSDVAGQPVSEASILRFALDRRLRLSVNFVNKTYAHVGRAMPVADFEVVSTDDSEAVPRRVVLWRGGESTYGALINDQEVVQLSEEIASIDGLWDLSMIGCERLDVEHEYQQLTGGPAVRSCGGPDLTLVCRIDGLWGQLLMHEGDTMPPSRPSPESLRLKRSFPDWGTSSDAEDAEAVGEIPPGSWSLAPSLPKDGLLVVRAEALKEFERRYLYKVGTSGTTTDDVSVQSPSPLPATEYRPATWEDVGIEFISEHRVQVSAKGRTYTQNYAEMGFADGRTKNPNLAWEFLRQLAESDGTISTAAKNNWPKIEKRVQEIRAILRAHFLGQSFEIQADSDPLPFAGSRGSKESGYRASFTICVGPSYKT